MSKESVDQWEVYLPTKEEPRSMREILEAPKESTHYQVKRRWWIIARKKYPIPRDVTFSSIWAHLNAHNLTTDKREGNGGFGRIS